MKARAKKPGRVVLIIDEINRGDPSRILGEALTYIEADYRGQLFSLPYTGRSIDVPANLVILGTMNPYDKSIAQLDMAFMRRFDHVDIKPSSEVATGFLEDSGGFTPEQVEIAKEWFDDLQKLMPDGIGHAYLRHARGPDSLRTVWRYRMLPFCEAVHELDETKKTVVRERFDAMFRKMTAKPPE